MTIFQKYGIIVFFLMMLHLRNRDAEGQGVVYTGNLSGREYITSFIIVGDTQRTSFWEFWRERNDAARSSVLRKIADENPAFIIHLGDLVFQGSSQNHWLRFDAFASEIRNNNIPVFPILGNHDYYGNNTKALHNFFSRFPHLNRRKWSSFRFHSVGIILLNSNFKEQAELENKQQVEWYINKLDEFQTNSTITVILIACHYPPYTNSKTVNDNIEVQKYFVEPFNRTPKARLFFSGHSHSYEHFIMNDKHFIVSGGGGGPRHRVETNPDKQRYEDSFKSGTLRNFHFCRISILNKDIKVQMVQLNPELSEWEIGEEFLIR